MKTTSPTAWMMLVVSALVAALGCDSSTPEDVGSVSEGPAESARRDGEADSSMPMACGEASSIDGCLAMDGCDPLAAQPLDPEGECWSEKVMTTCDVSPGPCGAAITFAAGPDGSCWKFTHDCLPDGWTESRDCTLLGERDCR